MDLLKGYLLPFVPLNIDVVYLVPTDILTLAHPAALRYIKLFCQSIYLWCLPCEISELNIYRLKLISQLYDAEKLKILAA